MIKIAVLTFLFLVFYSDQAKSPNFSQLILIDIEPTTKDHLDFFSYLDRNQDISVIFLKKPTRLYQSVQFIAETKHEDRLRERMRHYGISNAFVNRDIQGASMRQSFKKYSNGTDKFDFENFHDYDDISRWFEELTLLYPNTTELKRIGNSAMGKPIYALIIRNNNDNYSKVVIEAGIHGNEWLPIAFVTYLINALLNARETSELSFKKIAETIDWYLIPVINPDGYEYSSKTDRFWKKNRNKIINSSAVGVNLDRNFDYNWGEYGSSSKPSHEYFCGLTAFSEPETRALAYFVNEISNHLLCYFSFHSYGQNIIIPFGDSVNHNEEYLRGQSVAEKAAYEIKRVHGTKYTVGTNYDTNGMRISGNSASWVKKEYNTKCVYTFQMQDTGRLGYFMPSKSITSASNEIITAITTILDKIPKPRYMSPLEYMGASHQCSSQLLLLLFICIVLFIMK